MMKRSRSTGSESGFSMVEITIVIAIIVLLAAIVIPRMFQAKMKANEASAEASIHAITVAQMTYNNSYPSVGFSNSLGKLSGHGSSCETVNSSNACLINSDLGSGLKDGYMFEIIGDGNTPDRTYRVTGVPQALGTSGSCAFSSDQTGAVTVAGVAVESGGRSSGGSGTVACASASGPATASN
jgi:prepilin-type N-terminal cleavage/methylation domain-containing protein